MTGPGATNNVIGGNFGAGAANTIDALGAPEVAATGVQVLTAGTGNTLQGNVIGLLAGSFSRLDTGISIEHSGGTIIGQNLATDQLGLVIRELGNVVAAIDYGESNAGIFVDADSDERRSSGAPSGRTARRRNRLGSPVTESYVSGASGLQIGPGNIVAHNTGDGISIATGTGNRVVANSIHDNGGKGIALDDESANNALPLRRSTLRRAATAVRRRSMARSRPVRQLLRRDLRRTRAVSGLTAKVEAYLDFAVPAFAGSDAGSSRSSSRLPVGTHLTTTLTNQATGDTSEFSSCVTTVPDSGRSRSSRSRTPTSRRRARPPAMAPRTASSFHPHRPTSCLGDGPAFGSSGSASRRSPPTRRSSRRTSSSPRRPATPTTVTAATMRSGSTTTRGQRASRGTTVRQTASSGSHPRPRPR